MGPFRYDFTCITCILFSWSTGTWRTVDFTCIRCVLFSWSTGTWRRVDYTCITCILFSWSTSTWRTVDYTCWTWGWRPEPRSNWQGKYFVTFYPTHSDLLIRIDLEIQLISLDVRAENLLSTPLIVGLHRIRKTYFYFLFPFYGSEYFLPNSYFPIVNGFIYC